MKKLLSLFTSLSLLTSVSSTVIACQTKFEAPNTWDPAPYPSSEGFVSARTEFVKQADIINGISKDADRKKDSDNVSVYFLKRNAAFVGVQSLLSILNTLQDGKEVYYSLSQNISPGDANGEDAIAYSELNNKFGDKFHFKKTNNNKTYILRDDVKPIFDNIKNKKVDLYFEDFQLFDAADSGISIVEQLAPYMSKINTITITTDGVAQFDFEKRSQVWLDSQTSEYKAELTAMWEKIIGGKIQEVESKYFMDLDKMLPSLLLTNSQNQKFVNVWAASAQIYVDALGLPYTWNQVSTGLGVAYDRLSAENKQIYKKLYSIENVNLSDGDYLVHTGGLMKDNPEERVAQEAQNIVNAREGGVNIIYKPHPREDEQYYEQLLTKVAELNSETVEVVSDWLSIARALTPIEVFALTGVYKSTTNKNFHYSVTASSTTVLGMFEAGAKGDIQQYVFSDVNQKNYLQSIYGTDNNGVVDWTKSNL